MKIAVIIPGPVAPGAVREIETLVSAGTKVTVLGAAGGVLEVAGDIDLKAAEAAMLAMRAEREGCDAVVIDGMCDFGLPVVRGAVGIPVVGAATATYNLVYQLARRFAVISVNREMNPMFERAIRECGCSERMTSLRAMPRALRLSREGGELPYSPQDWEAEILKIAARQVEDEGAQCIVVACASIFGLLRPGARERLAQELGVIVVDPQAIALKTAEMLVALGLAHSPIEYPRINPVSFEDRFREVEPDLRRSA
ncbi:MAG: hypothetical protein IT495_15910 [Gammaproteobacteria bacterium]|nr:hypothetical protein [Gammaproteobacteria bacterium]